MKQTVVHYPGFLFLLNILIFSAAYGQGDHRPLLKIGGFLYRDHGFSAHLEFERTLRNIYFLTSGPRLDYMNIGGSNNQHFTIGYDLKFYPLYWKHKKPYQGIFIGVEPLLLAKLTSDSRQGPGLAGLLGYQYLFKNKFSLGFEGSMMYIQNLNEEAPSNNSQDRYYYVSANIKIGFKL